MPKRASCRPCNPNLTVGTEDMPENGRLGIIMNITKEYIMWGTILLVVLAAFSACVIFLSRQIGKYNFIQKISKGNRVGTFLLGLVVVLLIAGIFTLIFDITNGIIIILHLSVFWMLCRLIAFVAGKIRGTAFDGRYIGIVAVVLTVAYLTLGLYQAHHVQATYYSVETTKSLGTEDGKLRIAFISDSHFRKYFDDEWFAETVEKINSENPDAVFIVGDFVDDDTSRELMVSCCALLGKLTPKYGTYYVCGNHDRGYFSAGRRGYSGEDLIQELKKNGVTVLDDNSADLVGNIKVLGREDASQRGRKSAAEVMDGEEENSYVIVLDHQPVDYTNETAAGCDLVLSGHTHGGNLIPLQFLFKFIGSNDRTYGYERRALAEPGKTLKETDYSQSGTDFIVSSGVGCWSIQFKTGCVSEYVVVDISEK